jgi:hypothetical protein
VDSTVRKKVANDAVRRTHHILRDLFFVESAYIFYGNSPEGSFSQRTALRTSRKKNSLLRLKTAACLLRHAAVGLTTAKPVSKIAFP